MNNHLLYVQQMIPMQNDVVCGVFSPLGLLSSWHCGSHQHCSPARSRRSDAVCSCKPGHQYGVPESAKPSLHPATGQYSHRTRPGGACASSVTYVRMYIRTYGRLYVTMEVGVRMYVLTVELWRCATAYLRMCICGRAIQDWQPHSHVAVLSTTTMLCFLSDAHQFTYVRYVLDCTSLGFDRWHSR